jgi:DNA-directed RNA polymerase I and III subunit RPAC2
MEVDTEPAPESADAKTIDIDQGVDASKATFTLTHEDHTLGNAVRYVLAKKCARPHRPAAARPLALTRAALLRLRSRPRACRVSPRASSPEVSFVGYSVPHPSEPKMNVRVQTTGVPATDVLRDALITLYKVADHIDVTFADAVSRFKAQ